MAIKTRTEPERRSDPRRGASRARQEQFLEVVSRLKRAAVFEARHRSFATVRRNRAAYRALTRVLAADVVAPSTRRRSTAPMSTAFAVRAADTAGASDGAPKRLVLNAEVIACGRRAGARVMQAPRPRSPPAASSRAAPTPW